MSIRIATTSRLAAWLEARASAHVSAAYMRAEDDLSNERHNVRHLQSSLADALEANTGHRQARAMDAEAMRSLETSLTVETALVDFLAELAQVEPIELAAHRESVTKSVTEGESALRRAMPFHPSTYTEGEGS